MRKALRWAGISLGAIVVLLLVAAAVIFVLSEMALRKEHRAAAETLPAPTAAQLADAPRQARIQGCFSCHGDKLQGKVMFDAPGVARVVAPNLTALAASASDQQLAAAIRQGIGHDGRALFVMPSPMYSRLDPGEVAALIAWLRSQKHVAGMSDRPRFGPLGRFGLATGRFRSAPEEVERFRAEVPIDLGPAHADGRRLAASVCSECHGPALFGQRMGGGEEPPDLSVSAGYDLAQFTTLMRTGQTPSGKKLGLMEFVARNDLKHLTNAEIDALHAYLAARAKRLGS
ncbi:MAG TPA: c-type cytochrome [Allosphingosinicella sp.]|nr:c-type cytochrome [Allosphingosinicella sp.]